MAKATSEGGWKITAGGRTLAKPRKIGGAVPTKKKRKTWYHQCGPSCSSAGARGKGAHG